MAGARIRLEDLPPAYRAQAERQLGINLPEMKYPIGLGKTSSAFAEVATDVANAVVSEMKRKRNGSCGSGPNKTESLFNIEVLGGKGMYEAVTLRLPGKSRYTPDYLTFIFDPLTNQYDIHVYEVKGTYRLGSHGRALTAFREARAAFPFLTFHWYERKKGGGWEEKYRQ